MYFIIRMIIDYKETLDTVLCTLRGQDIPGIAS